MDRPPPRRIGRLLVANRGEIAQRIISSARELGFETFALYLKEDASHTFGASHSIALTSPETFMNTDEILSICKSYQIDSLHPGYGFLSESADFARRMWEEGNVLVVGPGWTLLDRTGDKLKARKLAEECGVPVLPALRTPTNNVSDLSLWASQAGYPIMVKAVDGGGGRGIRLIRGPNDLEAISRRAIEESSSKMVFAEKAAEDVHHVEIQIFGDHEGHICHAWERQCSIQRRYQKVVEVAPAIRIDRLLIARIIEAAIKMAKTVNWLGVGTFEFLVEAKGQKYYFLEVNPRLQVEHTLSESMCSIDIVQAQMLIAQGHSLATAGLKSLPNLASSQVPNLFSCQLRITAENVESGWTLSTGKLTSIRLPNGNGIRVDSAISHGQMVTTAFDSLLAKIIITGPSWEMVVRKAARALEDTIIEGVKTNIPVLLGVVTHPDFLKGQWDTSWLEQNQKALLDVGKRLQNAIPTSNFTRSQDSSSAAISAAAAGAPQFRRGDAWSIKLNPKSAAMKNEGERHHLFITKLLSNAFPNTLSAEIDYTTPRNKTIPLRIELSATTASGAAVATSARRADPADSRHVVIPFPGTVVEVCVDVGDVVKEGDPILVVRQMKMEIELRAKRSGRVEWVWEGHEGDDVDDGVLAAVIESDSPKL